MKAVKIQNSDECSPLLRTALQPSRKLCRSLFGPIDHEQVKEDLQKELEKDLKAKCELWCFDFFSGRPSPDKNTRFNWEAIRGLPSRPISPKTSSLPKDELRQFSVAESEEKLSPSHEKHPVQLNTSLSSALQSSKSSSDSTTNDDSSTMKRKRKHQQAAITDYMKQRKRRRVSQSSYNEKVGEKFISSRATSPLLRNDLAASVRTEKVTC